MGPLSLDLKLIVDDSVALLGLLLELLEEKVLEVPEILADGLADADGVEVAVLVTVLDADGEAEIGIVVSSGVAVVLAVGVCEPEAELVTLDCEAKS